MSYPVSNAQKAYANEMPEDESYPNDEFGGDYDSEMEAGVDESGDTYVGVEYSDEEGGGTLGAKELRDRIADLLTQLKSSDLPSADKSKLKRELQDLQGAVNHAMGMGDKTFEELARIQEVSDDIENRMSGVNEEGIPEGEEAEPSLVKTMESLKEKIQGDSNLDDKSKDKILKDLGKLITSAELHKDDETALGLIEEKYLALNEEYLNRSLSGDTGKAQELADKLGVSVDQIISAAEAAGVDLENPQADDKLMKMLQALNVPSSEDLANYNTLRDKRTNALKDLNLNADAQTQGWRTDSERIPDVGLWQKLYNFYTHNDEFSPQLKGITDKMGQQLSDALGALGLTVEAGTKTGQIKINGTELDFLNEDAGTYKLDSVFNELTDSYYSPAPRNTEASDFCSDENGMFWDTVRTGGVSGYPEVTFSSG